MGRGKNYMIDLSTACQIITAIAAFWSVYSTRRFWLENNRPIVTAEIVVCASGVGAACFNLVVFNSGNRPAVNIRFEAEKEDIEKIISEGATEDDRDRIHNVFSENSKIPLLLNGGKVSTGFFSFSDRKGSQEDKLKYEGELFVKINYSDMEGEKYISEIFLRVRGSQGFGGSVWT